MTRLHFIGRVFASSIVPYSFGRMQTSTQSRLLRCWLLSGLLQNTPSVRLRHAHLYPIDPSDSHHRNRLNRKSTLPNPENTIQTT